MLGSETNGSLACRVEFIRPKLKPESWSFMAGRVEFIRPKQVFLASLLECTQSIPCGHGQTQFEPIMLK